MTHGWNQNLFEHIEDEISDNDTRNSPIAKADRVIRKLKQVKDWAQASMAASQESQEHATNRARDQAPGYKVGEKVWLNMENIKTNRPCKKLDARHAKFTVTEVVGSHSYRLDTPPGIHNVFHSRLLRPANSAPLKGQVTDDGQPSAILVDGSEEYEVEKILDQKRAPGKGKKLKYLVKWVGYAKPTWEPESFLQDNVALIEWKNLPKSEKLKHQRKKKTIE
ncbi:hypothetical protein K3495_g13361 [Podosphaera aphanis]|nr:hypothetical protein K3495_g13361 [Podosphaera aphanis]